MSIDISFHNNFIVENTYRIYLEIIILLTRQTKEKLKKSSSTKTVEQQLAEESEKLEEKKYQVLINISIAFILFAIQISIPSIKSKKTFPGCKKAFIGFPLQGKDLSALSYICCIVTKIKSNSIPWKFILKKKQDKLEKEVSNIIDSYILTDKSLLRLINEKI